MATTLALMRAQVSALLMDSGNLVWDTGTLDQGIRMALAEYNLVVGATARTIKDLDSASSTTLPAADEQTIIIGAAGWAAMSRAVNRSESFDVNLENAATLMAWANARKMEFGALLQAVRLKGLQGSSDSPNDDWEWEDDWWQDIA